ncbi:hypothetical protein [Deminuibacter soli]|uniref:Uncharacterized protein n=1 Tax=Deminuibacter soli TaxID=2291815 RepID=A0A3E1NFK0_9BACT|nr:hypothetical protein [Deminuibacter soli]RFM26755.1 hypothetical protein DXN05_17320 [Deminuibacter soli]
MNQKKLLPALLTVCFVQPVFAQNADKVLVKNTNTVDAAPSTYSGTAQFEFKTRSVVNVPGSGTYSGMMTFAQWGDNTGGKSHQLNFNDGGIYHRAGLPQGSWESWERLVTEGSNGDVSVGKLMIAGVAPGVAGMQIGVQGDPGNLNVPLGAVTGGYNIDFPAYRDNYPYQVGARIRAERINKWQPNSALIQPVELSFCTSDAGTPDNLKERLRIKSDGTIGINTGDTKGYQLAVNGTAIFTKAVVKAQLNWPDYVFDSAYQLPHLDSVAAFIQQNKHLPEVPSATEVQQRGVDLAANQAVLLKKMEELTLYMIEQDKKMAALQRTIVLQQEEILQLKNKQ